MLILVSVPIAIVANSFRIVGTGFCGQYWSPDKAEGFFHTFSGWFIFLISLVLLVAFHHFLLLLSRGCERRFAFFVPQGCSRVPACALESSALGLSGSNSLLQF